MSLVPQWRQEQCDSALAGILTSILVHSLTTKWIRCGAKYTESVTLQNFLENMSTLFAGTHSWLHLNYYIQIAELKLDPELYSAVSHLVRLIKVLEVHAT